MKVKFVFYKCCRGGIKLIYGCGFKKLSKVFSSFYHELVFQSVKKYTKQLDMTKYQETGVVAAPNLSGPIWIFWWQGVETAPPLVQACIFQAQKLYGKRVIVVTQENYQKYCCLPQHILDKHQAGIITTTHFSDVIRFHLLKNYGGIWMDATIYLLDPLSEAFLARQFVSIQVKNQEDDTLVKGRWAGFFIGGVPEHPFFTFAVDFYDRYWKLENQLVDYFLMDYIFMMAYRGDVAGFSQTIDQLGETYHDCFFLYRKMNNIFEKEKEQIQRSQQLINKLTYKEDFLRDIEGKSTVYQEILVRAGF